jgi:hypothetical protein
MTKDTLNAVETNRKLTPDERELTLNELDVVSGGAFDAFLRMPNGIHELNPQPLPPG